MPAVLTKPCTLSGTGWPVSPGGQGHDLAVAQDFHRVGLFGAVKDIGQCVDGPAGLAVHL